MIKVRLSIFFSLLPWHVPGFIVKPLLVMGDSMAQKSETADEPLDEGRLKKLAQRQQALQDELNAIQAKLEGAERRAENREKVLLGVGVQEALSAGKMERSVMVPLLDLLTPKDRAWMIARGWGSDGSQGVKKQTKAAREKGPISQKEGKAAQL